MDIKMLSFGESISGVLSDKSFLSSHCYFEKINLRSFSPDKLSKNIFDFKAIEDLRNYYSDHFHLQDSLLLISDEEPEKSLENFSHIYVSLINLPMWNEKIVKDSMAYVDARNEIKKTINGMIDKNIARLYAAFEYCDFVLLCDASKVTLNDYLQLINQIRMVTITCKKTTVKAIHNVITIYGYSENNLGIHSASTEKLSLTVGMSFKNGNGMEKFKQILCNTKLADKIVFSSQVFGQYDYIGCWNDISYEFFNKILAIIGANKNLFLNWRIYIGSPGESLQQLSSPTESDSLTETELSELSNLPLQSLDFLKNPPFENHLAYAINDINYSLKLLLSKGMAQYYVLSFYESFNSFISYLKKLSYSYVDKATETYEIESNKRISEKVFDMFRTYFGVLNALNECTTHSRKQFLQIAPCQTMYFDAPPKLIAFYTAIINRIVRSLNFDIKDKYTFLITPDFKNDIFVDSLTEDKTLGEEYNLLIIHMSEESMYNIVQSLKIVVHEIFHHIGQPKNLRHQRSKIYLKCCLANMLSSSIPHSLTKHMDNDERYKFFADFVDELYSKMFTDRDHFFPVEEWFKNSSMSIEYNIDEVLYYSDYLIRAFVDYINFRFSYRSNIINIIYEALTALCHKGYNLCNIDFWETENMSTEDQSVLREFALKNLAYEMQDRLTTWIMQNNCDEAYSVIQYVFRETFADARMLMLISDEDNRTTIYRDTLGTPMSKEDIIRKATIIKCFAQNAFDEDDVRQYRDLLIINNEGDEEIKNLFYLYLCDQAANYLSKIEEPKSNRYISTKRRINEIFKALNSNDINDIMNKMDEEIFNYRKLLIEKDDA